MEWLLFADNFCYDRESPANNDEKRQHFLQHKEKHKNTREAYRQEKGKRVCFAAVFTDITRKGVLSEEASIHTAEITALREIPKRK